MTGCGKSDVLSSAAAKTSGRDYNASVRWTLPFISLSGHNGPAKPPKREACLAVITVCRTGPTQQLHFCHWAPSLLQQWMPVGPALHNLLKWSSEVIQGDQRIQLSWLLQGFWWDDNIVEESNRNCGEMNLIKTENYSLQMMQFLKCIS